LLTSILLLSATWALAQYSSGSSAADQNTSGSQNSGAYGGSSTGTPPAVDQANQGVNPGSSDNSQSEPQSSGQSISSQQGETSSDMSSQDMSSKDSSARAPQGGTASGRTMTFQGCLSESNGKFHLTDKMGTSYELTGKTANLKSHVGHTIAVTGKATASGENQPGAMSEQGGMEQTLQVSSFRHISGNCKSSAGSSEGSSGGSSNY
jgi:hypothetical protein